MRVRLDMAKFLQETLRESGLKANAHIVGSDAFKEFFRKVQLQPSFYYLRIAFPPQPSNTGPFHRRIALRR